jgi:pentose-5-phosphate-3-epimerase
VIVAGSAVFDGGDAVANLRQLRARAARAAV